MEIPQIFKVDQGGYTELVVKIDDYYYSFSLDVETKVVFKSTKEQIEKWVDGGLWSISEKVNDLNKTVPEFVPYKKYAKEITK